MAYLPSPPLGAFSAAGGWEISAAMLPTFACHTVDWVDLPVPTGSITASLMPATPSVLPTCTWTGPSSLYHPQPGHSLGPVLLFCSSVSLPTCLSSAYGMPGSPTIAPFLPARPHTSPGCHASSLSHHTIYSLPTIPVPADGLCLLTRAFLPHPPLLIVGTMFAHSGCYAVDVPLALLRRVVFLI